VPRDDLFDVTWRRCGAWCERSSSERENIHQGSWRTVVTQQRNLLCVVCLFYLQLPAISMLLRDFWATVYKTVRPMLSDSCLSCLFCLWRWCIVAKRLDGLGCHLVWTMDVSMGPGDIMLDGDPSLPKKEHSPSPQFSVAVYCGHTVARVSNCWALVYVIHRIALLWNLTQISDSISADKFELLTHWHCSVVVYTSLAPGNVIAVFWPEINQSH